MFGWIVELAEYERAPEQVHGSRELLEEALFGSAPSAEAVIAESRADAGGDEAAARWEPSGFALFYRTFSTWESRPGIWLEDLYVPPAHRRSGIGAALLTHVAELTVARGYTRLEWSALNWNDPALNFYAKLGADRLDDWIVHRLDGASLARVAGEAEAAG